MRTHWRLFVIYALLVAAAVAIGWSLRPPGETFTLFWPLTGLVFSALLLTPRRWWLAGLALTFVVHVTLRLVIVGTEGTLLALLLAALQVIQCYLAARIALALLNKPRRRAQVGELLAFGTVAALIAPGLVWMFAALAMDTWFSSDPYHVVLTMVWFGDILSVIAVGSVFCAMALLGRQAPVLRRSELTENLLVGLLLAVAAVYGFGPASAPALARLGLPEFAGAFVATPLMLWSAVRCDPRITAVGILSSLLIAASFAGAGAGPFVHSGQDWHTSHIQLQVYFFIACSAGTALSWVMYYRRYYVQLQRAREGVGQVVVALFRRFGDDEPNSLPAAVNGALATLGSFAAADRAALLRFDEAAGRLRVVASWRARGIVPSPGIVDGMPLNALPLAMRRLKSGQQVFQAAHHRGADADATTDPLRCTGAQSAGLVPIVDQGQLVGALSVEWVREQRYWSDDVIALLHLVGQLYVGARRRARTEQLVARYQQRLRSLAAELALAEEQARRAAAVHLHDGVAQNLAVTSIKLAQLEEDVGPTHPTLVSLRALTDDALRQTRGLFLELSPPALYELGLVAALRTLAESMTEPSGVRIRVVGGGVQSELTESARLVAYRVVSELLDNVLRHAHATECTVSVNESPSELAIVVADDGVGFDYSVDAEGAPTEGGGLFEVRERVVSQGGRFDLESSPGAGTVVAFTVPTTWRAAYTQERYEHDTADS